MTDALWYFGRRPEPRDVPPLSRKPDWAQADPAAIERALEHALGKPGGGWFVLGASRRVGIGPARFWVDGTELVVWRDGDGQAHAAPATCPHMGADLCSGRVERGKVVCPWHGLALGPRGHGDWKPFPVHDDGVLTWVRLPNGEAPTDAPILAPRPTTFFDGVIRVDATCEPSDVLANRLDPWHGAHYHPHSFANLRVLDATDDVLTLRVAYRVVGKLAMEVDATFHCPDPRTIVMTIVRGEGVGSVVETHATPLERPDRTAVIEATLATSERPGFGAAVRLGARAFRPAIEARARRLWVEDAEYAERRYALRRKGELPDGTGLTGKPRRHLTAV